MDQNLLLQRMRDQLTAHGFAELRNAADVDTALAAREGTTLLMFNSVCGCAAGAARPGVVLSLDAADRPTRLLTVFAGQDREATERARAHFPHLPASSPSAVVLRDGQAVFMLHRHDIEGHTPDEVAAKLRTAYSQLS
ncbi:MAG: BrxA/BrxB family bacilliredoxin [Fimbriimonadaceae bacterium]|nr:BrxA/BrxB family bacilliredoxin [Fimbriimonadaceae bacterium]